MIRWVGPIAVGVALGAVGALSVQRALNDEPAPLPRPIGVTPSAPPPAPRAASGSEIVSLAQIQEKRYGFERDAALYDLLQAVDASGIEALVVEASALDLPWLNWPVYSRYVDLAPRQALRHLVSQRPVETPRVTAALFAWAQEDLDAALAFAETLDQPLRTEAGRNLLYTFVDLSDAQQDEIARRLSVDAELTQMRTVAGVGADPANAWQSALSMTAGELRTRTLWAVAHRWLDQDPAAALSALDSVADDEQRSQWQRRLLVKWVGTDRQAALRWSASLPPSAQRTSLLGEIASLAARDSPVEVLEFAATLEPYVRRAVARRALGVWATSDPRAAAAWLDGAPDTTPGAVDAVVHGYAELDAEEAFDWLLTQSPEAQRSSMPAILGRVAEESPEAALELIDRIDDAATTTLAEAQLMSSWARDDPHAAVRAIARLGERSRPQLYGIAFAAWSRQDREAATAFLGRIPVSGRDVATNGMLQQILFAGDVQAAEELFDRLVDERTRRRAATTMYFHLSRTDPKRAERYREISDANISAEDGSMTVTIPTEWY